MMSRITSYKVGSVKDSQYQKFDQLDGSHPWQNACPEGCVLYRARILPQGRPIYFNFVLAKEMGLIPQDHPHELNHDLSQKLADTFSLQIINEYDEISKRKIDPTTIKNRKYMATRYLQLQHSNKQGKTSGDGRGIWNGIIKNNGITWDVSSRGTGVTCLAPGAVKARKPLKTGSADFGYGCGQAEIDELIGAALFAEVLHLQGIPTERVLCVIDLGRGLGIGVRAAVNLLRPAHIFLYLKQNRFVELKKSLDYFIKRQIDNRVWKIKQSSTVSIYQQVLNFLSNDFAKFVAILDTDYIFAWLDWDGDNVLANAGIIDYGSIRQFGIRHDKYRYDDVDRYSTCLNEQISKAKLMIQVFCQAVDFVETGKKKPLKKFANHTVVKNFYKSFNSHKTERLLYRLGFTIDQRNYLKEKQPKLLKSFEKIFNYLDRAKVSSPEKKVSDGINHPALFNIPKVLRLLPQYLTKKSALIKNILSITESKKLATNSVLHENHHLGMSTNELFSSALSGFANSNDKKNVKKYADKFNEFQSLYFEIILSLLDFQNVNTEVKITKAIEDISRRSSLINTELRMTGNALIQIVDNLLEDHKKYNSADKFQTTLDELIQFYSNFPEVESKFKYRVESKKLVLKNKIKNILIDCSEDI